jgi:hypothetical protein
MWRENPYGADLGDRDCLAALGETPDRLRAIAERLRPDQLVRSYQAGKWTAAQLFLHLAQTESAFGYRVRMAITSGRYIVQPFDQDVWLAREPVGDGLNAFGAYYAMRKWNLPLFRSLTPEERRRPFHHPERGPMVVEWILEMLAGHELHHLAHIETIARV